MTLRPTDIPDHLVLAGLVEAVNDGRDESLADYDGDEIRYASDIIAGALAGIQAQTLRDFADWLDKTEDLPPKTCADLAREQAALITGDPR